MPSFYEFFAGGGMARAGLGQGWDCLFANDIDKKKARAYVENWPGGNLVVKDVGLVSTSELPATADLAWASFPCQDLSLAGMGAGLKGSRSGTFWPFWRLIKELKIEGRQPRTIVLENVCGALTSHKGEDFRSLMKALWREGYRAGALVIDAAFFLPHSRPRLFIVGISEGMDVTEKFASNQPLQPFHSPSLIEAYKSLPLTERDPWLWWRLPVPRPRLTVFADLIEDNVTWHTQEQTRVLLDMMSPVNRSKVLAARKFGRAVVGSVYKRTRVDSNGQKTQRAEVRFDDLAGCLRTPGGGSSRQLILAVRGNQVRSRLLSSREAARLMGVSEQYILPANYTDAYHLMGDGVAVPVVRHLAHYLLEPLLQCGELATEYAA